MSPPAYDETSGGENGFHPRVLTALPQPIRRNRVESGSSLSETGKFRHGCEVAHVLITTSGSKS